ncbi:MAG: GNAT family N-acetyltransferase [Deltaproteobacteria bacterium]|jgi:GNAT superfamily N-acetyltransferase|nr:GNAT family N-acetyltransferase [Deltaproteobacteria bacterium]
MTIVKATLNDLPKVLSLQKLAYLSEAILVNNLSIQPLTQTLEEIEKEFSKGLILIKTDEKTGEIIGSIRAHEENGRVQVGKLMIHPDYQNRGLGTSLLKEIETYYKNKTFELFTSGKSKKNLHFYLKNGYKEFKREKVTEEFDFVFLEK